MRELILKYLNKHYNLESINNIIDNVTNENISLYEISEDLSKIFNLKNSRPIIEDWVVEHNLSTSTIAYLDGVFDRCRVPHGDYMSHNMYYFTEGIPIFYVQKDNKCIWMNTSLLTFLLGEIDDIQSNTLIPDISEWLSNNFNLPNNPIYFNIKIEMMDGTNRPPINTFLSLFRYTE